MTVRNDRRNGAALLLAVTLAAPGSAMAGPRPVQVPRASAPTPYEVINAAAEASEISAQPLRGGVVLLQGSGGNMVVLPSPQGLLMVDAGIAVSEEKLEAKLHQVGPGPVRFLVNSHWHWDHTDGNVWLQRDGATVVGQVNTAEHLTETIRVVEWGHTFPPLPAGGRVALMIRDEMTMAFGGDRLRLRYYGPAHTDGDLSAYFLDADVLVTGDTWWNGLYPFIDYVAGGSIDGMIGAANANLEMAGEETIAVPGHGPVGGRRELEEYRDMLVAIRNNVAALKQQGMTLDQIIAARPTSAFDASWGQSLIGPELFTRLVYRGV